MGKNTIFRLNLMFYRKHDQNGYEEVRRLSIPFFKYTRKYVIVELCLDFMHSVLLYFLWHRFPTVSVGALSRYLSAMKCHTWVLQFYICGYAKSQYKEHLRALHRQRQWTTVENSVASPRRTGKTLNAIPKINCEQNCAENTLSKKGKI